MTSPARVESVKPEKKSTRVRVVIREGKKRQVRRMFESIGNKVIHLKRVRIGNLRLGNLPRVEWREREEKEVQGLMGEG